MDSLSDYFNADTIRLDELAGSLRQNVPPEVRRPDGAWVVLRRYLPKAITKGIDREYREALRQFPPVEGRLGEDYYDVTQAIAYRDVIAHVIEWSYPEPVEVESLDELPGNHTDAMIAAVAALKNPVTDEVALRQAYEAEKRVPSESERRADGRFNGAGTGRAADLEATTDLVPSRPSLA